MKKLFAFLLLIIALPLTSWAQGGQTSGVRVVSAFPSNAKQWTLVVKTSATSGLYLCIATPCNAAGDWNRLAPADSSGNIIGSGVVNSTNSSAGLRTHAAKLAVFDPVATDSGRVLVLDQGQAITITRVYCGVKAATNAVINLEKRAEGTPFGGSPTSVLTSDLTCTTSGANSSAFASAGVATHIPVGLKVTSVSGTPDTLWVAVEYTIDTAQ